MGCTEAGRRPALASGEMLGGCCKHVLTTQLPSPFVDSEGLLGGAGFTWSTKSLPPVLWSRSSQPPPSACIPTSDSITGSVEPPHLLQYFYGFWSQGHRMSTSHSPFFLPITALLVALSPSWLLSSDHTPWSLPQRHCLPFIPQCTTDTRLLCVANLQRPRLTEGSQSCT